MKNLQPQVGDTLLFGKYLKGFNRRGQPVYSDGKEKVSDKVTGVYEDSSVRSSTGDTFKVRLKSEPIYAKRTLRKRATWVTYE
jgi:hypothetical protein